MSKRVSKPVSKQPTINYAMLERVCKIIAKRPKQLEMSSWFTSSLMPLTTPSTRRRTPSHCGTAACLAGWVITLHNTPCKPMPSKAMLNIDDFCEPSMAMRLLRIDGAQTVRLFYIEDWPDEYRDAYDNARTYKQRAKATIARVRAFIDSKGAV